MTTGELGNGGSSPGGPWSEYRRYILERLKNVEDEQKATRRELGFLREEITRKLTRPITPVGERPGVIEHIKGKWEFYTAIGIALIALLSQWIKP